MTLSADDQKKAAAAAAMDHVRDGMKLGLGTGSTAKHFVDFIGAKVAGGWKLLCVPTSEATRTQAASLNIPLTTLDETPELDLTVDGADELDADLTLIKGGGGALLREKMVAASSARMIAKGQLSFRMKNGAQFVTDNGNYIIDGAFGIIPDAKKLALALEATPGVVDHGLFIGLADLAILGAPDGVVIVKA